MTKREFDAVCESMNNMFHTRNNLLTFSFTAALAIMGLAFTGEAENMPMVYLLPFFLILPFTGRITYYRVSEARLAVCLEKSELRDYVNKFDSRVPERRDGMHGIIAILVNYEMFFLSIACLLLCYCKYPKEIAEFQRKDYLYFGVAIMCVVLVFCIITSAFNFDNLKKHYRDKWNDAEKILK